MAPADLSGYNTCPKATDGCKAACLNTAGRGGMFKKGATTNVIQEARMRKTAFFFEERKYFMEWLVQDIELAIKQSAKKNLIPVFRLNGTSDLSWEKYEVVRNGKLYRNIFAAFPDVQFYDYTKVLGRKVSDIKNYHLTFSMAENNYFDCKEAVKQGMNVAVVFGIKKGSPMPEKFFNYNMTVFNGDDSDLRFLDPKNVIVGLYAKGKAKKDTSGFVKFPIGNNMQYLPVINLLKAA
ncbi:MAG: hypothetical protein EBT51_12975 [Flavobacteriaceae bacterium]|nr:hypothetical protein [Flavobacteriaceae bacterium]